jgi:hypothetical protein
MTKLAIVSPHKRIELVSKALGPETQGVRSARGWIDAGRLLFEQADGRAQGFGGLIGKENAGRLRRFESPDRFQRSPLPEGNDWRSAGLRLKRCYTEVLYRGKHERARTLHVVEEYRKWLLSHKDHIRSLPGADPVSLRSIADYNKLAIREPGESINDQIDPLVGHETGSGNVKRLARSRGEGELIAIYRRVDHSRVPPVDLADSTLDELRDGNELVYAGPGSRVPVSYPVQ